MCHLQKSVQLECLACAMTYTAQSSQMRVVAAGCATVAEVRKRGDDFWGEFEFYLSDLVVGCVLDCVLVGLLAPAAVIGAKPKSKPSGKHHTLPPACWIWHTFQLATAPAATLLWHASLLDCCQKMCARLGQAY